MPSQARVLVRLRFLRHRQDFLYHFNQNPLPDVRTRYASLARSDKHPQADLRPFRPLGVLELSVQNADADGIFLQRDRIGGVCAATACLFHQECRSVGKGC